MRSIHRTLLVFCPLVMLLIGSALAQTETPPMEESKPATTKPVKSDPITTLLDEIDQLHTELAKLRMQLAEARLEATTAARERDELRRFMADHREFGDDYQAYQAVKAIAEREARQREAERKRAEREQLRIERRKKYDDARAQRDAQRVETDRLADYHRAGFAALGLDVYLGRMAYHYETKDATRTRVDYEPGLGHYLRLYPNLRLDYSHMTISGSALNAANETRNIGIAITFFDEDGNQVGSETVSINNARPNVPYPFTATISMALDRPFASSSQYVLFADAVE